MCVSLTSLKLRALEALTLRVLRQALAVCMCMYTNILESTIQRDKEQGLNFFSENLKPLVFDVMEVHGHIMTNG